MRTTIVVSVAADPELILLRAGYDDARSTRLKVELAKKLKLGGVGSFTGENVGPLGDGFAEAFWDALGAIKTDDAVTSDDDQEAASSMLPRWDVPPSMAPNTSMPAAGLRLLHGTEHSVVYSPGASERAACNPPRQSCNGTYNHAPLITSMNGVLVVGWHSCAFDEDSPGGRALFSTSVDGGKSWRPVRVLFANLSASTGPTETETLGDSASTHSVQTEESAGKPFCVLDTASSNFYVKVGGDPSLGCGWDGGNRDKCCRRKASDCRWYANKTSCTAALKGLVGSAGYCLSCAKDSNNIGCPPVFSPGHPHGPPPPNASLTGTNLYMRGFTRINTRTYAVGESYNSVCSASCRRGEAGKCEPSLSRCCKNCLGCCGCAKRQRLPYMMRQMTLDSTTGEARLGEAFWAADSLPAYTPAAGRHIALLSAMDATAQLDVNEFLALELKSNVTAPPKPTVLSERSTVLQRTQRIADDNHAVDLALVIRDDNPSLKSSWEWASLCSLQLNASSLAVLKQNVASGEIYLSPDTCHWTAPVQTQIPDSRAKTCAGVLPLKNGGADISSLRYIIGNQLPKRFDRDPLTISLSTDGVSWDRILAVRAGAPKQRYPGFGKGPGYQYPAAALLDDETLVVAYSVNKEDIAVTRIKLPLKQDDGAATRAYRAFSCNTPTQNVTTSAALSSGVKILIVHSQACPIADTNADPLGPCFVSPAEVKAALAAVPPGKRAISLEGGTLFYLEHLTDRTPHEPVWYFLDNLPRGSSWKNHTASGPWFDVWAATVQKRFTMWFAKFKEIGGTVDYVLSDFELGGHASYFHFKEQSTFGGAV